MSNTKTPMTYVITFDVKPGQAERFRAVIDPVLDAIRGEDGVIYTSLNRDLENENRFLLFETWSDHDDVMTVQLQRPYRAEMNAAFEDILINPQEVAVWQPLRADP